MTATHDPLSRWRTAEKPKPTGSLWARTNDLIRSWNDHIRGSNDWHEALAGRLCRLEREVFGTSDVVFRLPITTDLRWHDGQIKALQLRVDTLTRALAKHGIVGEELFEDSPMADSCPLCCDPGTGCPHCERQPELYCWRCEAAKAES